PGQDGHRLPADAGPGLLQPGCGEEADRYPDQGTSRPVGTGATGGRGGFFDAPATPPWLEDQGYRPTLESRGPDCCRQRRNRHPGPRSIVGRFTKYPWNLNELWHEVTPWLP